ncbi:hypothetical protein Ancab_031692 [Ancistrocladus abbreviatus]
MASNNSNRKNNNRPSAEDEGKPPAAKKYEDDYKPTATTFATIARMEEKRDQKPNSDWRRKQAKEKYG